MFFIPVAFFAQENCANGVDDDGDGLVDLNDSDCPCTLNNQIGTTTSLLPNTSFENFLTCPTVPEQVDQVFSWHQITQAGPDYFNNCGPFAGIVPVPMPDGDGVLGFAASNGFLEYVGAEPTTTLTAGTTYRIDFDVAAKMLDGTIQNELGAPISSNINLTIYGNATNTEYPVATTTGLDFDPGTNWVPMGTVAYSGSTTWSTVSIVFTPAFDVEMIALGPPSALPFDYIISANLPYFFIDNLVLNEEQAFASGLSYTGDLCTNDGFITTNVLDPTIQWYHDGVTIVGQNNNNLDVSALGLGAGEYTLTVWPGGQCEYTSVTIDPMILPDLSYTTTPLCEPGTATFNSTSTIASGSIASTTWTTNIVTNSQTATDVYNSPGNYNVTLSATSDQGCTSDSTFVFAVETPPVASFDFATNCTGVPFEFISTSTLGINGGDIVSTGWNFGDGNTLLGDTVQHSYLTEDEYDVTLLIITNTGCGDDTTVTVTVNPTPVVDFTFTPVCVDGDPMPFVDMSTISAGTIDTLEWDFGDGSALAFGLATSHLYAVADNYDVTLTAISDLGCESSMTQSVLVSDIQAEFDGDDLAGCAPVCVNFTDESNSVGSPIVSWLWEYSNGGASTDENPSRCFNNNSLINDTLYDVMLTVMNDVGCTDSILKTDYILAAHNTEADFSWTPSNISSINPVVSFISQSTGASNHFWNLGGEFTTSETDPVFPFDAIGTVEVTQVVTSENNCVDSLTQVLFISPEENIFVPNAFTPDEDGLNDLFAPIITGSVVDFYEFFLYDRYGQVVFQTLDHTEKWNGHYLNEPTSYTSDGLYNWRMRVRFEGEVDIQEYQGVLTVMR